jgi:hypothetical protein
MAEIMTLSWGKRKVEFEKWTTRKWMFVVRESTFVRMTKTNDAWIAAFIVRPHAVSIEACRDDAQSALDALYEQLEAQSHEMRYAVAIGKVSRNWWDKLVDKK